MFRKTLTNNYLLFEKHAFRKFSVGQTNRSVINASLWDVMSTELASLDSEEIKESREELIRCFSKLLHDGDFVDAITYSPNSTSKVKKRFTMARAMLKEIFGDYKD